MSKRITICCLLWLLSGCQIDAPLVATQHPNELSSADSSHVAVDDSPEYDGKPLPEKAMQHPSIEQLIACDRVELRAKGQFRRSENHGDPWMKQTTATASWKIASLGPDLNAENYSKDTYRERRERLNIEVLDSGLRVKSCYNYYNYWEDANGGYYEEETRDLCLLDLRYLREDSTMYIYRALGPVARMSIGSKHEFTSRFEWWQEILQPDSSLPIGEVIFYK